MTPGPLNPATPGIEESLRRLAPDAARHYAGRYCEDPRGLISPQDALLLAPASSAEIAAIIRHCRETSVAVVPFGGGTGLVGGQLPQNLPRPVVLSLERLNRIREISAVESTMTAEAGCTLQEVQTAAASANRLFPLSLAAKGSCQIGGNLATNAGGVHVLRYGNARDLCLGLEVVLPDGQIWDGLTSLRKDNAGYDLKNVLIGSEGTLGIITAASLKLFRQPAETATALLAVPTPQDAVDLLCRFQDRFDSMITAFELISGVGFEFLAETDSGFQHPIPSRPDWMVLVELGSVMEVDAAGKLAEAAAEASDKSLILNGVFAASERQRSALWSIREAIPEANRKIGSVSSHDLSVPMDSIAGFIEGASSDVSQLGDFRINCFGHVGDGNLHFNVFPPRRGKPAGGASARQRIRRAVHRTVRRFGGSISAEHGIGRLHADEFLTGADPAHLSMMRAVKRALDPAGIMNPGAALPNRARDC